MLLTDSDMSLIRQAVETQSGINTELVARCSPLIHIAAFDDAVRQAFIILEERLRRMLKRENATGMQLVGYAFSTEGPFTKLLIDTPVEREGLQNLLTGAFKLYRNPTAHTIVGYKGAEARSIIALVDLLLKRLDDIEQMRLPATLPENLEQILQLIEKSNGGDVSKRVRSFSAKCISGGLFIREDAKQWIPFRKLALTKTSRSENPRPHPVTVFYLYGSSKEQILSFPISEYYSKVVNIEIEPLKKELRFLGFQAAGKAQSQYASLKMHNSQEFLDQVFGFVQRVISSFEATLN